MQNLYFCDDFFCNPVEKVQNKTVLFRFPLVPGLGPWLASALGCKALKNIKVKKYVQALGAEVCQGPTPETKGNQHKAYCF